MDFTQPCSFSLLWKSSPKKHNSIDPHKNVSHHGQSHSTKALSLYWLSPRVLNGKRGWYIVLVFHVKPQPTIQFLLRVVMPLSIFYENIFCITSTLIFIRIGYMIYGAPVQNENVCPYSKLSKTFKAATMIALAHA